MNLYEIKQELLKNDNYEGKEECLMISNKIVIIISL